MMTFVYKIPPIDYYWESLHSFEEVSEKYANLNAQAIIKGGWPLFDLNNFSERLIEAKKAASAVGWDGDFMHGPKVFWLPSDHLFIYGFVWKQENDGTTFVVSPVKLDYLETIKL